MSEDRHRIAFTFSDLFCGIGGFRVAAESFGWECVFSCDIDEEARRVYKANFGEEPAGDIIPIKFNDIPNHDVLFAGFPCQPFSIIGSMNGVDDTRGTLFKEIARILEAKRPRWFILENVKQLATHNNGFVIKRILEITAGLGYFADSKILNALDFGLPQKRERVFIVGTTAGRVFQWPSGGYPMTPLSEILEKDVPDRYYASQAMQQKRAAAHQSKHYPSIWHENKAGHISSYPYSCALRANASYNYLLVNGNRRLTPREQLRLQGFPDWFKPISNDSQTKKQTGNAVPIPVVEAIINQIIFAEEGALAYETKNKAKAASRTPLSIESVPT